MNNPANALIGPGGAPTRATTLPDDAKNRKRFPVASGVLDYFPDAIVALAEVSWRGNEQHNPGKSLRWDRAKSGDESDTMMRHFLQRGTLDTDGMRHSAKLAWRALALLQKEIEAANAPKVQEFQTPPKGLRVGARVQITHRDGTVALAKHMFEGSEMPSAGEFEVAASVVNQTGEVMEVDHRTSCSVPYRVRFDNNQHWWFGPEALMVID